MSLKELAGLDHFPRVKGVLIVAVGLGAMPSLNTENFLAKAAVSNDSVRSESPVNIGLSLIPHGV